MSKFAHRWAFLLFGWGCGNLVGGEPAPVAAPAAPEARAGALSAEAAGAPESEAAEVRFAVPFAWETSPDEPLARTRAFVSDVLRTNELWSALGSRHFARFSAAETPRATVLTCADSRVQTSAWDASPENDDFTIRNLGGRVDEALTSIEYGVQTLHTPILLVIGHSGCDSVERPAGETGPADKKLVVAHVHSQVTRAVRHFRSFVHSGELTVIGAVYDFRNDFGRGHGRLHLIDVNSNTEPSRVEAFVRAVLAKSQHETAKVSAVDGAADPARIQAIIQKATSSLPGARTTVGELHTH